MAEEEKVDLEKEVSELSDEDLDKALTGVDDSEESASDEAESTDKEASEEQKEGEETASDKESTETDIPDWVPESMRKHYLEGNHEEVYKSVKHMQEKIGEYGEYKSLIELMRSDPNLRSRVIDLALGKETVDKKTETELETEVDKFQTIIDKMKKDGYDDTMIGVMQDMKNLFTDQLNNIRGEFTNYQKSQMDEYVRDNTDTSLKKFAESIKEIHSFDEGSWMEFLQKVPQTVLPTGGRGKAKFYTEKDLMNAFMAINPDTYRQYIESGAKNKLIEEMRSANEKTDDSISASDTQHDSTQQSVKKLEKAKSREEMENMTKKLSDKELDEELEQRGLARGVRLY
jgi:hypothetical protein